MHRRLRCRILQGKAVKSEGGVRRCWPRILLAIAPMVLSVSYSASAQVSGIYVFNGSGSCLIAQAGFNSAFQPLGTPVFLDTFNTAGVRVFNNDGTGRVQALGVSTVVPVPPGTSFTAQSSSASAFNLSYSFTYTIGSDRVIQLHLVPGSYSETFNTGPRIGQTATQNILDAFGMLSADGKTFITITGTTEVETKTFSNSDVRQQVCHRSGTGLLEFP